MVNATNYNGMRGSVHYGRTNIWNRYHMNASFKAARTPAALPMVTYTPVYQQPHCCGWNKALGIISTFAMGFGLGNMVTGNQQQNTGMYGMGGMPGMMGGWNWFC